MLGVRKARVRAWPGGPVRNVLGLRSGRVQAHLPARAGVLCGRALWERVRELVSADASEELA